MSFFPAYFPALLIVCHGSPILQISYILLFPKRHTYLAYLWSMPDELLGWISTFQLLLGHFGPFRVKLSVCPSLAATAAGQL